MIHITIICDALCVDLMKFVLNLRKENIFTNYILVAPFCEMHSRESSKLI